MSRALNRYGDSVIREVKRIVVETAQIILSNAKMLAPVDDGNLRDSIEMEVRMDGLKAKVQVTAHYAIYVEYGTGIYAVEGDGRQTPWTYWSPKLNRFVTTRGMSPQPFWEPAIDAGQQYFDREMGRLG
ncbi:HK97-gp10 family putative phage morphogenesis protein [Planomicrobium okeanokoites]|uniref:HK97-gp10 family putative phage morphogenesis protein n=1 Tax=Planomicrobium okeanokoites TaxID=244 RepID=UPI000A003DF0|nr:HK97-gp10 family putative phage morphogenesis protein [Planomicrobium okeanokoites]